MHFVHPLFLIALVSLAIPVIIHLFNFRRYKRIYFTNVRFLAEIQQETKQQSRLKQLLILLARLLTLTALVSAFAQPYLAPDKLINNPAGQHAVSIYLDNSWSMDAVATEGKLFNIAKEKALEIAAAYSPTDLYQLVTNDFEGRHQHLVSQEEFRKMVDEVQLSPASRTLPEIISRQNDILTGSRKMNRDAYLISDFQRSTTTLSAVKPDSSVNWLFVPLEAEKRDNLYIDSIWFSTPVHHPGQAVKLTVRIRNSGESLEKIPVKLTINKVQKAIASFSIAAGSFTEVILPFTENEAGSQSGQVSVTDYPIVYDDNYFFSYNILPETPVLCINELKDNEYINALFLGDSAFSFHNTIRKQINYSAIQNYSLVILNSPAEVSSGLAEELIRYVHTGGSLVIFPPEKGDLSSLNILSNALNCGRILNSDTVQQRVNSLSLESDVFNDVFEKNSTGKTMLPENIDLPVVFRHYSIDLQGSGHPEILMKLQHGQPFLIASTAKKGKVYLFAAPLSQSWTNFPQHLLFVPILYKISLLSNLMAPLAYTVGKDAMIEIASDSIPEKTIYKIKRPDTDFEIIPEARAFGPAVALFPHDQIRDAGFYLIQNGTTTNNVIAYNYNRQESDLSCYQVKDLEAEIKRAPFIYARVLKEKNTPLSNQIRQLNQGTPLWKFFILLALLFIAAEILLIRILKD